jgi:hypothetical protein
MSEILNNAGFENAKALIRAGLFVPDERDNWSEDQPSTIEENEYLRRHGFGDYAKWYLGIDDEMGEDRKGRYKFPFGDFTRVHRCGLLAAESRAGQYKHLEIERAAAELLRLVKDAERRAA